MDMGVDLDLHCLGRDQVRAFVDGLRAHADREDALLYPWATRHLSPEAATSVAETLGPGAARSVGEADSWKASNTESSSLAFRGITSWWARSRSVHPLGRKRQARRRRRSQVEGARLDRSSPASTPEQQRDDQVRSPEFFDIARFGRAVFTSTEVKLPEGRHPVVVGSLDLHGVKADVSLEITG